MVTAMLAVPLAKLAVGVKTAVLVKPEPVMSLSVPPVTATSPTEPSHAKLLPGSSENVNVMLAVSPALSVDTLPATLTVGVKVSMLILGVVPAVPLLPAGSSYELATTVMLALPFARLAEGVKTAVLMRPEPLIALSVPPETARSPAVPFQVKLVPGSSEKENVMAAVSPDFRLDTSERIVTDGASVKMLIEGEVSADPVLPAASW